MTWVHECLGRVEVIWERKCKKRWGKEREKDKFWTEKWGVNRTIETCEKVSRNLIFFLQHISQCMNIHILLNKNFASVLTISSRVKDNQTKCSSLVLKSQLLPCWSGLSKRILSHHKLLLVIVKILLLRSLNTSNPGHNSPTAGTDLQTSSLRISFSCTRRLSAL